ncbi:Zn-finger, RING domain containing protein [Cardiosporidium cionae]|uniref:Zn-finger, RING domain containing protein n=1 Tax=Cardiosporidium cionae TaxID=476202 RepID=A0ABQ7JG92_9APIC|nr:Zn-finger, RING domain containing protein [Cardiosporidium cionae]|eukprot:KAF8822884.1 Zn-finger, RING domain containing protein [Cardiosporidium cionae]
MSRHSKSNTAHSIFTYHERRMLKDVGTLKERLGTDSMRRFEQCWLCLRSAKQPVATRKGFIFCKECLMLNLADQKAESELDLKIWEQHKAKLQKEVEEQKMQDEQMEIQKFVKAEISIPSYATSEHRSLKKRSSSNLNSFAAGQPKKSRFAETNKEEARASSFWVVENAPSAPPATVKEPKKNLLCPISKTRLRIRDLIYLKPELLTDDTEATSWICPITKKVIALQKAVAIIPTGQVILKECVKKYVLGKNFCDQEITEKDLIPLIPGGSAFSYHNQVESEKFRAVLH